MTGHHQFASRNTNLKQLFLSHGLGNLQTGDCQQSSTEVLLKYVSCGYKKNGVYLSY